MIFRPLPFLVACLFLYFPVIGLSIEDGIDRWISDLKSSDVKVRREAAYQLNQLGKKAKPAVEALTNALKDRDIQVWFHSVHALTNLGPEAKPATKTLIRSLSDYNRQVRYRSAIALSRIGEPAVTPLIEVINETRTDRTTRNMRLAGCLALKELGPTAKEALPHLLKMASRVSEEERSAAFEAVGKFGEIAIDPLLKVITNSKAENRVLAAKALYSISKRKAQAADHLIQFVQDSDPGARTQAILAFRYSKSSSENRVQALIQALTDAEADVRKASMFVFTKLKAKDIVPALVKVLNQSEDADAQFLGSVSEILGSFQAEAQSAIQPLVNLIHLDARDYRGTHLPKALGDLGTSSISKIFSKVHSGIRSDRVEGAFVEALIAVGPNGVLDLSKGLESKSEAVKRLSALALAGLGKEASSSLSLLVEACRDQESRVRSASVFALGAIGLDKAGVTEAVVKCLDDPSDAVRGEAILALSKLGIDPDRLLKALLKAIDDPSIDVKLPAIEALLSLGPRAVEALTSLNQALGHRDDRIKIAALKVIAEIGEEAKAQSKAIFALCNNKNPDVQLNSLLALEKIQGASSDHLDEYIKFCEHSNPEVQIVTLSLLSQLGEKAQPALSKLEKLYKNSKGPLKVKQTQAMARLIAGTENKVQFLIGALKDKDSYVRKASMDALGNIGSPAQAAVPLLFEKMGDEYERRTAYEALRRIKPQDVEVLKKACQSRSRFTRGVAVRFLGNLGWKAESALDVVRRLTKDSDGRVKYRAREALEEILKSLKDKRLKKF